MLNRTGVSAEDITSPCTDKDSEVLTPVVNEPGRVEARRPGVVLGHSYVTRALECSAADGNVR